MIRFGNYGSRSVASEDKLVRLASRGLCGEFAAALHQVHAYPLRAWFGRSRDDEQFLHAFAVHPHGVVDAHGVRSKATARRVLYVPSGLRVVEVPISVRGLDDLSSVGLASEEQAMFSSFILEHPERYGPEARAGRGTANRSSPAKVAVDFQPNGFTVTAFIDRVSVGDLIIRSRSGYLMSKACELAFHQLADEVGARHDEVMIVRQAEVDQAYRSKGIGERLYRLAARVAARRYNEILASDSVLCSGTTSTVALSVWNKLTTGQAFRSRSCGATSLGFSSALKSSGYFIWGGR